MTVSKTERHTYCDFCKREIKPSIFVSVPIELDISIMRHPMQRYPERFEDICPDCKTKIINFLDTITVKS
jgi:hypothetical protein